MAEHTDTPAEPLGEAWLEHSATKEQLQFFEDEGYLIVENALSPETVQRLTAAADRLYEESSAAGSGSASSQGGTLGLFRSVSRDDAILDLVDHPTTFPLIYDILGWNVQLYISHLIVYPPEPSGTEAFEKKTTGNGWHIDGGRPVPEMEERPQPRLSLKVAYFLTDTTIPFSGAMRIVPRSHKMGDPPPAGTVDPPGAIDVCVKPGTAVLFDRRMWHSRGNNYSQTTRKVIFMGYSYRWMRGLDYNLFPEELLQGCTPIRRQLLGDGHNIKGWWQPTEDDVPLKGWLDKHGHEAPILETNAAGHRAQKTSTQIFVDNNPSPFLPARSVANASQPRL